MIIPKNSYTVSEIVSLLKRKIENESAFSNIGVEGEISNLIRASSGHYYFKLKDNNSVININLWSRKYSEMNEIDKKEFKEGAKVLILGSINLYAKNGSFSLIANKIIHVGKGELWRKFEELKEKLLREGIFDSKFKKKIKIFNFSIGIITSKSGSVIRDIESTINRRWPYSKLHLYSVNVQGRISVNQIHKALKVADRNGHDVLILARGGGSIEDLWSFNEEKIIREIFNLKTPIITGIGHETDTTLSDLVSDFRAETPTSAAEKATPNKIEIINNIKIFNNNIDLKIKDNIAYLRNSLSELKNKMEMHSNNTLSELNYYIDSIDMKMNNIIKSIIEELWSKIRYFESKIDSLNQNHLLELGYSIVTDLKSGNLVNSIKDVKKKQNLKILLSNGELVVEVKDKSK